MTALLAVRGPLSRADCYGVVTAAPIDLSVHDDVQLACLHLAIQINQQDNDRSGTHPYEVTFDETDIQGTFHPSGRPDGVIGLWVSSYTPTGVTFTPAPGAGFLTVWDPTPYEVPDLQPAANGYMETRGFTWAPGVGKRPYP